MERSVAGRRRGDNVCVSVGWGLQRSGRGLTPEADRGVGEEAVRAVDAIIDQACRKFLGESQQEARP